MRKMLLRLAIPVLAVGLLSACGIGSGPVITDHVAEKADTGQISGGGGPPQRRSLHINDPVDLVMAFLRASAGDSASDGTALRSYIADDAWVPRQVSRWCGCWSGQSRPAPLMASRSAFGCNTSGCSTTPVS